MNSTTTQNTGAAMPRAMTADELHARMNSCFTYELASSGEVGWVLVQDMNLNTIGRLSIDELDRYSRLVLAPRHVGRGQCGVCRRKMEAAPVAMCFVFEVAPDPRHNNSMMEPLFRAAVFSPSGTVREEFPPMGVDSTVQACQALAEAQGWNIHWHWQWKS